MVCMLSPLLSVRLVTYPAGLSTAVTMVHNVVVMNGVQAGVVNDDIAVVAVEDITVIVTGDIGAVVVIVNHVKKKDIVVVTVSTVVVKVVVDIVAVAVAVKVVIRHTAVNTHNNQSRLYLLPIQQRPINIFHYEKYHPHHKNDPMVPRHSGPPHASENHSYFP